MQNSQKSKITNWYDMYHSAMVARKVSNENFKALCNMISGYMQEEFVPFQVGDIVNINESYETIADIFLEPLKFLAEVHTNEYVDGRYFYDLLTKTFKKVEYDGIVESDEYNS
jgi:hypothetical protein